MANPEHVKILKQGVKVWNKWKSESLNCDESVNDACLHAADFLGLDDPLGAELFEMSLIGANPNEFLQINLRKANLTGENLSGADLSGDDLSGANLKDANLIGVNFKETNLNGTNLSGSNIVDVDFRKANLSGANFKYANISGANFSGAILLKTNFQKAMIDSCNLDKIDLSKSKNLKTVIHDGPSPIGIDTIYKSNGEIPKEFLLGCGLSPWEIEVCRLYNQNLKPDEISEIILTDLFSKRMQKFPFHRGVFISYCHEDSKFVDKLRDKLKDSGNVTVWLDRHDMEAGDLQKQVHRQLRIQDIVLVVLSKDSIESDWVESELYMARKIEKEEGRDVLCPVCLDDSWKDMMDDVLWGQLGKKYVVDFSAWKTKKFGGQFTKLLNGIMKNYEKRAGERDGES